MYVHTIILQEAVDRKDAQLQQKDTILGQKDAQLQQKDALLGQKDAQLQQKDALLGQKDAQFQQKDEELALLRSQQTANSLTKLKVRFCSGLISEQNTIVMSECFP